MKYRFGQFEFDESARELTRKGVHVETEPKAFELLAFLLRNRSRAVSKDELLSELWPRSIVTETALTRCVMKARRAVGDDSDSQAVIRTLHGHGYRFVADVDESSRDGLQAAEDPGGRRFMPRFAMSVVAGAIFAALLAGYFVSREIPDPEDTGVLAVLPITNMVEDEDLSWVRIGLMSLMQRMLEDGGVEVVSDRAVLRAVGEETLATPPNEELLTRIRLQSNAESVLHTTLDLQAGLYRLSTVIAHADGRKTRRVIVGESATSVAAAMAQVIVGLLAHDAAVTGRGLKKVSTDPFVNEVYGRALDLELQGRAEEARTLFQIASSQEPELFWLRYEIALCTRDLREWDKATELFNALYEEADAVADVAALVATLNSHGVMKFEQNDYDAAEALFLQALDTASERSFAANRASINVNLALVANRRGEVHKAREHYEMALEAFDEGGLEPSPNFNNNYAGLLLGLGDLSNAQDYSMRAVEGFRLRGERRFEAPSLNRLAKILRNRGDTDGALARHEQALFIYRELGDIPGELSVMTAMTTIYRENGDLTRARLNGAEVAGRAMLTDDTVLIGDAHMQLAYVYRDFANFEGAIREFEFAETLFEMIGDDSGMRAAKRGIALAVLATGDIDRAATIADTLLKSAQNNHNPATEVRAIWLQGMVAERNGDFDVASEKYRLALAYARENNDQNLLVGAAISMAGLHLEKNELDPAGMLVDEIRPQAATQHDFMRLDARLSMARGENQTAHEIMTELRSQAGESWSKDDESLLEMLSN